MKASYFVLILIIAFSAYLIQLWEPKFTAPLYIGVLSFCFIFGLLIRNVNLAHIALFLFIINGIEYVIFQFGVINLVAEDRDYLTQGTLIFGTQFIISLLSVFIFLFRVQISRKISNSQQVVLTHFDTFFHWFFILSAFNCLAALLENTFRNIYQFNFQLFYDIYPLVSYIIWALTLGALVTMMILSIKENDAQVTY
ncbi:MULTISPECIES: hypothetical protein [Pseudoalteromonas]|uniref:Uncharacterized protein n=1 Tax=Pseudoalteromonas amylolytica TaxID=1859457 RepID=A0A1S1MYF4_9GAMM|nr:MULTISPECIES: hypothetical protein [Pseudoalteromonas]OHU89218.1 hypothetical protein BFC16_06160 [Pseudoalteromonas sp. JW3]OHU92118.1 hypothetical protein BET10_07265 [Pseudoalteromonas amylolytica]